MTKLFLALPLVFFCIKSHGQPGFCGTPFSTFLSANIFFEGSLNATLDGGTFPLNAYIIAYYGENDPEGCAGFAKWEGSVVVMTVNGDDGILPGYAAGESYKFMVQLPDGCLADSVVVEYDTSGIFSNPGFFEDGTFSKIVALHAWTKPWAEIHAQDGLCGSEDASLSLSFQGGYGSPYTILWSTGDTVSILSNLPGGDYQVTATDAFGCVWEGDATVSSPDELQIELVTEPGAAGVGCEASATVTGGTGPYTIDWSNGQQGENAGQLPEGPISATVTDANGCVAEALDMCVINSLEEIASSPSVRLYPNPTADFVFIGLSAPAEVEFSLEVSNPLGQTVLKSEGQGKEYAGSLDLSGLPAGVYKVLISQKGGRPLVYLISKIDP